MGKLPKKQKKCAFINGTIYSVANSDGSSYLEKFHTIYHTWKRMEDHENLPHGVSGLVALDGNLYVALKHGSVKVFNLIIGELSKVDKMRNPPRDFAFCVHKGWIYAVGGLASSFPNSFSREVATLDPTTEEWSWECQFMKRCRSDAAAVSCGELLYVLGGRDLWGKLSSIERYDPRTDEWMYRGHMIEKRVSHGAVAHDNNIYIIGGIGDHKNEEFNCKVDVVLNSCEVFNTNTGVFTEMAPMNTARSEFGIAINGDKIHCVGGFGAGKKPLKSTEVYDLSTGVWKYGCDVAARGRTFCVTSPY